MLFYKEIKLLLTRFTYILIYLRVAEFHRNGSVVVDYQVAVDKDVPNPTNTIVGAIKNESSNGTFGDFDVDVTSISADGESLRSWSQVNHIR